MRLQLLIQRFYITLFCLFCFSFSTLGGNDFDLNATPGLPSLVYTGHDYPITLNASNIPSEVYSKNLQKVEVIYQIEGLDRLDTPIPTSTGHLYHNQIFFYEDTDISNVIQTIFSKTIPIPDFETSYENKITLTVTMKIVVKADIALWGPQTYQGKFKQNIVACHPPFVSLALETPWYSNHGLAIPIGETVTPVKLRARHGSEMIAGLETTWNSSNPNWTFTTNPTIDSETVGLVTDGLSSGGNVSCTLKSTSCSNNSIQRSGGLSNIIRFVPRPDVLKYPKVCEGDSDRLEIEPIPLATGYHWIVVKGPVTLNKDGALYLTTTEPYIDVYAHHYGDVQIKVRALTPIDEYIESSTSTIKYTVEDDHLGAIIDQNLRDLRWRNVKFWAGGTAPFSISLSSSSHHSCSGPVYTYTVGDVYGAISYDWEIVRDNPRSLIPFYADRIMIPSGNKLIIDGNGVMSDGERVEFKVRAIAKGVNDCTEETAELLINYTYNINRSEGGNCSTDGGGDMQRVISQEIIDHLKIYPNPVNQFLTVKIPSNEQFKIEILNASFQLFLKQSFSNATNTIDVSNLPNGLYLIKIYDQNDNFLKTEKLIINH